MFRFVGLSLCIVGIITGSFLGLKKLTRGFRYAKIHAELSYSPSWEVEELSPSKSLEIKNILSQEFRFLDRGTQFYVFASRDGKYVLKFFRFDRLKPPFWVSRHIPFHEYLSAGYQQSYEGKLNQTMKACLMAYQRLKKQTGLIYLHLNHTENLKQTTTLVDCLGRRRDMDLNGVSFILQKKFEPLKSVMKRARDTKDTAWQKEIISSFFHLLIERSKANICNTDPDVFHNFGYLEDRVVEIDFGDYFEDKKLQRPFIFDVEIDKYAKKFRKWLEKHIPERVAYFDESRKKAVAAYSKDLL